MTYFNPKRLKFTFFDTKMTFKFFERTVGGKEEKKVWVFDQWDSQNSGRVKFATTFATPSPAFFVNA